MKIFIDPGHGGTNPGAIGIDGLKEAEINLDVSLRLGEILAGRGYDIEYSHTGDETLSLAERANRANAWGADYFISIHCNSNSDPSIGGTETFYYKAGTTAERFAETVNNALVAEINLRDIGIFARNLAVLRLTRMPAVLTELAFLTNPAEAALLETAEFRQSCAVGLADGITEFTS
ncbi:MAG: N-acetylmuramoyl-L-alanine amidase [Clostridiales bacterium]|nr:N-acetylmuramoyl-L-alanine amidase [Clostridiales bacterium]